MKVHQLQTHEFNFIPKVEKFISLIINAHNFTSSDDYVQIEINCNISKFC